MAGSFAVFVLKSVGCKKVRSENDCVEKQPLGLSLWCKRLFWLMADINAAACQSAFADNMDANQSSGGDLYYSLIAEEVSAM